MGVYIKGMEMPFTCLTCDFHKCAGGVGDFCTLTKRRQFRFKNRPKDCPLVPVPPHGRLIDADALTVKLQRHREYSSDGSKSGAAISNGIGQCLDIIDGKESPTIIPAEDGE